MCMELSGRPLQPVSDLARPVSRQRGMFAKLQKAHSTAIIEWEPLRKTLPLSFLSSRDMGSQSEDELRPKIREVYGAWLWVAGALSSASAPTPPATSDKIYLQLNMDLEREYFRNKIPDEIQLLSRNQRSLALNVGRGGAGALPSWCKCCSPNSGQKDRARRKQRLEFKERNRSTLFVMFHSWILLILKQIF